MNNRTILILLTVAFICSACQRDKGSESIKPSAEGVSVVKKAVLVEEFTGQNCGACPRGAAAIHEAVSDFGDKVAIVAHHVGYYEDDFTLVGSRHLVKLYDIIGAPSCMLDRTDIGKDDLAFVSWVLTKKDIEKQLLEPSYVSLMLNTSYDDATKELNVDVSGELLKELPNARLVVYITQDKIVARQYNGGDDYIHPYVLRAVLSDSDVYGDKFDVTSGKFTKTYTYTVPEAISGVKNVPFATNVNDMYVVAFVYDFVSKKRVDMKKNIVHNTVINKIIK